MKASRCAPSTCAPAVASFRFDVERDGRRLVSVSLPLRGVHNVVNATGAMAMALELGVDPQIARRRARQVRRRGAPVRHPRRRPRRDVRRRLRPPADRDRRRAPRRTQQWRLLAAGDRRVPAQPLQPHGGDVARLRRRVRRRRRRRAHRHLPLRHAADPGRDRQARRQRRARRPSDGACRVAARGATT